MENETFWGHEVLKLFFSHQKIHVLEILANQNTFYEEFKFLVQNFLTEFLKQSMSEVSIAMQKTEETKKIKTTSIQEYS